MNSTFKFTFDNYIELPSEAIGWDSSKITLQRNEKFGGIFFNYTGEYTFINEAYKYIEDQIRNVGYCTSIKVNIYYKYNELVDWQPIIEGYINLKNATVDNMRKEVKANIEPDNVYSAFLSLTGSQYDLFNQNVSFPNGKSATLGTVFRTLHYVEDGTYNSVRRQVRYWKVFDALDFLIRLNSQGRLSLVSDFFSTAYAQLNKWNITLTGTALSAGKTINVSFRNQFAGVITVSQSFVTSEANTLLLLCNKLIETTSATVDIADLNTKGFVRNYFTHTRWSFAETFGRSIALESWLPYEILSVTITGGTDTNATFSETQAYQSGGAGLCIATQQIESWYLAFPNTPQSAKISFDDLFQELDKIFYLGMKMEKSGDNFVLRIEPMDYFFSQTTLLRIEGVQGVTTEFPVNDNYNNIQLGCGGEYATHNYEFTNDIYMGQTSGNNYVDALCVEPSNYLFKYISVLQDSSTWINVYVKELGTPTAPLANVRLILDYTFSFTHTPTSGVPIRVCNFDVEKKALSELVNESTSQIGICYGETLNLVNSFGIDIDYHGIQVSKDYGFTQMNGSASPSSQVWTFCMMEGSSSNSMICKAQLINKGGLKYTRYLFNAHLTNHHKIINNFSRIKTDSFYLPKDKTTESGKYLTYVNTSPTVPKRVHKFNHFLSYSDIIAICNNPDIKIEFDIDGSGEYISCWIQSIEMNLNTKETEFTLYES